MSLLGHDIRTVKSWKAAPEEMSLEVTDKDGQWRCWRDVLRKTVPDTRGGNRKSSVTHLFSSQSYVLELTAQKLAWPVTYCCCFRTITKNVSFLRVLVYTVHQRHLRRCAI